MPGTPFPSMGGDENVGPSMEELRDYSSSQLEQFDGSDFGIMHTFIEGVVGQLVLQLNPEAAVIANKLVDEARTRRVFFLSRSLSNDDPDASGAILNHEVTAGNISFAAYTDLMDEFSTPSSPLTMADR